MLYESNLFPNSSILSPPYSFTVWGQSALPGGSNGKESIKNAGGLGLTPGLGRYPRERNGNPLQYFWLENPTDRGAWRATVHEVTESQTRLSD